MHFSNILYICNVFDNKLHINFTMIRTIHFNNTIHLFTTIILKSPGSGVIITGGQNYQFLPALYFFNAGQLS